VISYFVEGTGLWVFSSCSVSLLVWIDFGLYLSVLRIMIVNLLVLSVFAKEVSQCDKIASCIRRNCALFEIRWLHFVIRRVLWGADIMALG
jgi:hypothetical protein